MELRSVKGPERVSESKTTGDRREGGDERGRESRGESPCLLCKQSKRVVLSCWERETTKSETVGKTGIPEWKTGFTELQETVRSSSRPRSTILSYKINGTM